LYGVVALQCSGAGAVVRFAQDAVHFAFDESGAVAHQHCRALRDVRLCESRRVYTVTVHVGGIVEIASCVVACVAVEERGRARVKRRRENGRGVHNWRMPERTRGELVSGTERRVGSRGSGVVVVARDCVVVGAYDSGVVVARGRSVVDLCAVACEVVAGRVRAWCP